MISVLTHTDFPEPVAPAISKWGIFARSAIVGRPSRSLPNPIGSAARAVWNSRDSTSSRNVTTSGDGFGTSIPTAPFPGIGATTRMLGARIASARSSASDANCRTFTPAAGTTSNCVTTGPVVRPTSSPSTRNVRSASSSFAPIASSSRRSTSAFRTGGGVMRSSGGSSAAGPVLLASSSAARSRGVVRERPAPFRRLHASCGRPLPEADPDRSPASPPLEDPARRRPAVVRTLRCATPLCRQEKPRPRRAPPDGAPGRSPAATDSRPASRPSVRWRRARKRSTPPPLRTRVPGRTRKTRPTAHSSSVRARWAPVPSAIPIGSRTTSPARNTSHERSADSRRRPNTRSACTSGTIASSHAAGTPSIQTSKAFRHPPAGPKIAPAELHPSPGTGWRSAPTVSAPSRNTENSSNAVPVTSRLTFADSETFDR